MKSIVVFFAAVTVVPAVAAEQSWELRAEFGSLKPGDPEVAVLRLQGGRFVEVPIAALSPASQAAVRRAAAAAPAQAPTDSAGEKIVTVRGPFGRSVSVPVPESIKNVECDAIHCRSAADAADVYRLALADERLSGEPRAAAEVRLREWAAMADKGLVRLGDRWVPPEEARAAADEAEKVMRHAFELMRLDILKQAAAELQKARRADPECGQAAFVIGLGYALVEKDFVKAAEQFAEVVRLEPDNAAALNNLAVAEMRISRHAMAVEHFRAAVERAADPQPVIENISAGLKPPSGAGPKMPAKAVQDLNTLYRLLIQDMKLKPAAGAADLRFVGPDNAFCTAASPADIARVCESSFGKPVAKRQALGFVVAPGYVVCPRQAVVGIGSAPLQDIAVEAPADRGRLIGARLVAAPKDVAVALLQCDGLGVEPLVVDKDLRQLAQIAVVNRSNDSWLDARLQTSQGKVSTPLLEIQARGRFLHTAAASRGPGGGPIADDAGRVVGMMSPAPRTDESGNVAGFGIPMARIWPAIRDVVERSRPADDVPDQEAASGNITASVVIVRAVAEPWRSRQER